MRNQTKRAKTSIRSKIILIVSLLIIIIMIFVGFAINMMVGEQLEKEIKSKGEAIATNIAANSTEALLTKDELLLGVYMDKLKDDKSILYGIIFDSEGKTISHTDVTVPKGIFYDDIISLKAFHSEKPIIQTDRTEKFGKYIDISVPILSGTIKIGMVRLGFSSREIFKTIKKLTYFISGIAALGILAGIMVLNFLVSKITGPIKSLTRGAEIIGSGKLDFIIKNESSDEIGQLADTFNEMTLKLKIAQNEIIEQEKMKQELRIARDIQQSLLPEGSPIIDGFEVESFYKSAKEIGGDYYDFLALPGNRVGVVIADVSGKGIPGSLGMAVARSIFRTQVQNGGSAGEILIRTNKLVYEEIKRGIFVSMFFTIIDIDKRELNCASAGHNPPIFISGAQAKWVELDGMALGVDRGSLFTKTIKEATIKINKGDMLVHYTDGVTEAKNALGQEFGEDHFKSVCENGHLLSAKELNTRIIQLVDAFARGAVQNDDITLVTIKSVK